MAKNTYIIDLAFGTWQNQVWFCNVDEEDSSDRRWTNEAVKHFEKYGFMRIQR